MNKLALIESKNSDWKDMYEDLIERLVCFHFASSGRNDGNHYRADPKIRVEQVYILEDYLKPSFFIRFILSSPDKVSGIGLLLL